METYLLPRQKEFLAQMLIRLRRSLLLWVALLTLLNVRIGAAETDATITVSPDTGAAGEVFVVAGNDFTPGAATLFWDGQAVTAFTVPRDGVFETILVAPPFTPPGEHTITVCAGAPCLTGEGAQSASQSIKIVGPMAVFAAQIAFVHADDAVSLTDAVQFQQLLSTYGPDVRLIKKGEMAAHDFSQFDLVIIGSSSGKGESWGTPDEIAQIAKSRRILGLGQGGHALFGGMDLEIGYPNGARELTTGVVETLNPELIFQKIPHGLGAFAQRALEVYTVSGYSGYAITFQDVSSSVLPLAQIAILQDPQLPVIVNQGCRTLWGFEDSPSKMTAAGRALFANTVFFALGTDCNFSAETYCGSLSSPAEIPSARDLDFDDLKDTTAIADLYRQSHGVRFENGRVAQATVKADPTNGPQQSHSAPNVAFNTDVSGNGSGNVPMSIVFDRPMSHAGVWLGNGDATLRATLRAYDAEGSVICTVSVSTVPAAHTTFAGIYDALGRIVRVTIDYGTSLRNESIDDLIFGPALYAEQIRICLPGPNGCTPLVDAPIYHLREGAETGETLSTDNNGYLIEREAVTFGDALWAKEPVSVTDRFTHYQTTAAPVTVTPNAFANGPMTIELDYPLMAFTLALSAQWDTSLDTAYQAELRTRIEEASNHLYDFTDGQMALGKVTVYQHYDGWADADIRLYSSSTTRPKAEIGGVVTAPTVDPIVADVTYYPGYVHMGSTWSRFGTAFVPPGALINEDWALALAHELGHYLLYLYDTYLSLNEQNEPVEIDTCTGSAMGWAYEEANTEFVFDVDHWNSACGITLANQMLKRTEWATIRLWYANLIEPTVVNPGPAAPPVSLTEVSFQPPSTPSTPGVNQSIDLLYADAESASAAARGFLIRDQRVLDQGKPISGTTSITLKGASAGDRFCLFDISNGSLSRRQFGCKEVTVGDNDLSMKKNLFWAPVIELTVVASQTVTVSVTQALEDGQTLGAVLYPEDQNQATLITLTRDGDLHTGAFLSPIPATSAYVSVHVNEAATETNPRREVMVEYGTGGSGAYGPASRLPGVPIISGDGQAEYTPDDAVELAEGEFISWQSMAGSPSSPGSGEVVGTSYRLLALPPSLVENGTVAIRLPDTPIPTARSLGQEQDLDIHFWQDGEWIPLASQTVADPQGGAKVVARSQGVGIYALLKPVAIEEIYLPTIQK